VKTAIIIPSLGSGGAERQATSLAVSLQQQGDTVTVVTYFSGDFYTEILKLAGVEHVILDGTNRIKRVIAVRRFLQSRHCDVVLAFLREGSLCAEVASLPTRSWGLVISERSVLQTTNPMILKARRYCHFLADYIVTNSHNNRRMIEEDVPQLKRRTVTIYNAIDLNEFSPGPELPPSNDLRLVVAARVTHCKNLLGTIEAIRLARAEYPPISVCVDWYGHTGEDPVLYNKACQAIRQADMQQIFRIHPPTTQIIQEYRTADAVLLPSYSEGLPNSICEGMACGRPILMSRVSDATILVRDGGNGFLFDADTPRSIMVAIRRLAALNIAERQRMGRMSRIMSELMFDNERITEKYRQVLSAAAAHSRVPIQHSQAMLTDTEPKTARHVEMR